LSKKGETTMNINREPRATAPLPDEPFYRRGEQGRRWGVLLLVVGLVWLVFELTTRGSLFGVGLGFVERAQALPVQRYSAERVVIAGVNDRVDLVGWDEAEIGVEATRRGYGWSGAAAESALERIEVVVTERDETLHIEVRRPPSFGMFLGRSPAVDLRVSLPAGVAAEAGIINGEIVANNVRGDLRLNTVSGEITTRDTVGALQASITSGDLRARNHRGPLRAESVSGDIEIDGAIVGAQISTVSGDVELAGGSGELDLHSISGDLEIDEATAAWLRLESTSGDISASTALAPGSDSSVNSISGEVRLRLDRPEDLRLVVTTTSGEITSDLALSERSEERRRLSGQIGAGSASLTVGTTSGDITVMRR
jgi:hypothetical protein